MVPASYSNKSSQALTNQQGGTPTAFQAVEGKFLEVFAPRELVEAIPESFGQGQPIAITGESVLPGETPQTPILVFAQEAKAG